MSARPGHPFAFSSTNSPKPSPVILKLGYVPKYVHDLFSLYLNITCGYQSLIFLLLWLYLAPGLFYYPLDQSHWQVAFSTILHIPVCRTLRRRLPLSCLPWIPGSVNPFFQ